MWIVEIKLVLHFPFRKDLFLERVNKIFIGFHYRKLQRQQIKPFSRELNSTQFIQPLVAKE
jgi:hypothetical protein